MVLFGDYSYDCQKKYIIWNKISDLFPDIEWIYNKSGELKTENFDASDSLTCIIGYINKEKYKDNIPTVVDIKEETISNNTRIKYKVNFCENTYEKVLDL